jgi:hypothetical protein
MTKSYILDPTIDYHTKCKSIANAMTHMQRVQWAVLCAESVLSIYESKYPNDNRPRAAIEAAKAWMNNPSEENRIVADAAYAAADAAANAAYAAAAANVADAVVYAADAASYAAYAVFYAADAARAAAYAVEQKDLCLKYACDILFKKRLRLRRKVI